MANLHNSYSCRSGSYYLGRPDETQVQVIFYLREDAPFKNTTIGIVVNAFEDYGYSVYDAALALKEVVDDYIIHSEKETVKKLVEYLEKYIYRDTVAKLESEKDRLVARLDVVEKEIKKYFPYAQSEEND